MNGAIGGVNVTDETVNATIRVTEKGDKRDYPNHYPKRIPLIFRLIKQRS